MQVSILMVNLFRVVLTVLEWIDYTDILSQLSGMLGPRLESSFRAGVSPLKPLPPPGHWGVEALQTKNDFLGYS